MHELPRTHDRHHGVDVRAVTDFVQSSGQQHGVGPASGSKASHFPVESEGEGGIDGGRRHCLHGPEPVGAAGERDDERHRQDR